MAGGRNHARLVARLGIHILQRSTCSRRRPTLCGADKSMGAGARPEMGPCCRKQALVSVPLALSVLSPRMTRAALFRAQMCLRSLSYSRRSPGRPSRTGTVARLRGIGEGRRTCDRGLWRVVGGTQIYFFEWLLWIAFPLLAIECLLPDSAGSRLPRTLCVYWLLCLCVRVSRHSKRIWCQSTASPIAPIGETSPSSLPPRRGVSHRT